METALVIGGNEPTYIEASKLLHKQFRAASALLRKYFPEDEDSVPSPKEGLTCHKTDTFQKICMPLIRILDFFCERPELKHVSNADFHDGVYEMFKAINAKYERLFAKTCWVNKEWQEMMEKSAKN